jgi:putative ABC transport system ATP-binding protein
VAPVEVPDLAALEERARRQAAARAGGVDRLGGHIVCDGLVRIFKADAVEVIALQGLDLVVDRGELLALVGASGSGKSTLLNILAGLDVPTAGRVVVAGHDLLRMSARRRLRYHRRVVGFVWQQASRNLVPYLTAAENVALPVRLAGRRGAIARRRAAELLGMVGVAHCADRRPDRMSGGEQQRTAVAVAVAVAVANDPEVLLADEPTGELDEASAAEVLLAGLAAVGLALMVEAAARGRTLSLLRTMGLAPGQARWLSLIELLPLVVTALVAGAVLGVVLPAVLAPALGLAAFAAGTSVAVALDGGSVGLTAGLLLLLAAGGVLTEAAANRRLGRSRVLRLD